MDQWIYTPGFPLLEIVNYGNTYHLVQSNSMNWWLPIKIEDSTKNIQNILLLDKSHPFLDYGKYFKISFFGTARINYLPHQWKMIYNNFDEFDRFEKFNIIHDAFSLSFFGNIKINYVLV